MRSTTAKAKSARSSPLVKSLASALSHRNRRLGRTRGADHPDRRVVRLDPWPVLPMASWQRITLVAAGAGAGIAATFNTPIGGVHVRHRADDARGQRPHLFAGGAGHRHGDLYRPIVRADPAFEMPDSGTDSIIRPRFLRAPVRGARGGTGVAATGFVRGSALRRGSIIRPRSKIPTAPRLGMPLVGACSTLSFSPPGHYSVEGVGYATEPSAADRANDLDVYLLPLLFLGKLVAISLTIGSGRLGRDFFALAVHGRDAWAARSAPSSTPFIHQPASRQRPSPLSAWRRWSASHRRGNDRGDDDLRDDARLRHGHADDPSRWR